MKKSYVLFMTLVLIVVFSILANSILEIISIKNENFVQKTLYLQAKNHILFLEDYILNSDLNDTKEIKIDDEIFEIIAKRDKEDSKLFFLSVKNREFAIRLTKQIVIE
ncbi:hypothetical protein CRU87_08060 [Aliarcobacter trophiarum LMG 25534]|uniref:Sensor histidine kinase n=1 Tax=Aliarcobacter trophiarum LMG 25534 TaxID=1032241 RepID=A0ABY0EXC3_9BACT|nr:hypothetical protein [Aliarcobacter trophiarum]RXI27623.1 hypothetical protein CRU89_04935 [Aliarcobacter trophiarum]RXJ89931.1 hypothetical protein CRU87_08060 [Aliarcobacter trophiarum LMG 25534]